jgi:hypothetical protein
MSGPLAAISGTTFTSPFVSRRSWWVPRHSNSCVRCCNRSLSCRVHPSGYPYPRDSASNAASDQTSWAGCVATETPCSPSAAAMMGSGSALLFEPPASSATADLRSVPAAGECPCLPVGPLVTPAPNAASEPAPVLSGRLPLLANLSAPAPLLQRG